MSDELDRLLSDCADAGVIFRPRRGQLRPLLSRGRPPDALLARVEARRDDLVQFFAELSQWCDEFEAGRGEEGGPPRPPVRFFRHPGFGKTHNGAVATGQ
jgi:hypothetical protein